MRKHSHKQNEEEKKITKPVKTANVGDIVVGFPLMVFFYSWENFNIQDYTAEGWFLLAFLERFIVVNFPFDAFILLAREEKKAREGRKKAYRYSESLNFRLKVFKASVVIAVFIGLVNYEARVVKLKVLIF